MDPERVSAELFGRSCRLPVALWVLSRGAERFYQSEPPPELGPHTAVRQELSRLARAGLIAEERVPSEHRVYYRRTASPLWRVFAEAADVLATTAD